MPRLRLLLVLVAASVTLAVSAATANAGVLPCFDVALGGTLDGQSISPGLLRIFQFVERNDSLYAKVAFLDSNGTTIFSGTVAVQGMAVSYDNKAAEYAVGFSLPSLDATGGTLVLDPILVHASQMPGDPYVGDPLPNYLPQNPEPVWLLQALSQALGALPGPAEGVSPCFDVAVLADLSFDLALPVPMP